VSPWIRAFQNNTVLFLFPDRLLHQERQRIQATGIASCGTACICTCHLHALHPVLYLCRHGYVLFRTTQCCFCFLTGWQVPCQRDYYCSLTGKMVSKFMIWSRSTAS
jgi:hypothetical protein